MKWSAARKCCLLSVFVVIALGGEAGTLDSSTLSKSRDGNTSAVAASAKTQQVASTLTGSAATCPTGTINYITHTLPQQCLRIGRSSTFLANSTNDFVTTPGRPLHSDSSSSDSEAASPVPTQTSREFSESDVIPTKDSRRADSIIAPVTHAPSESQPAEDVESALDNVNFLSFEEWKVQNLEKVGQSPENIGRGQNLNGNRQRPDLVNALDTLGEESEIDLDFTGFGSGGANAETPSAQRSTSAVPNDGALESQGPPSLALRSKDAGKTCKERTNYASFDCAATALKSNKECKSSSAILVENKDSYMLNICSATNKFIIVELCDDILVDTVVLANYEFFSSSFRHFRVSVSDRYPVKIEKWKDLGTYEARNTREIQAFLVENPLIWARYLRIEFLTHYGSEYYCPVSLLRVHGTTMLEEFRHQEDIARGEEEESPIADFPTAPTPSAESDSHGNPEDRVDVKFETPVGVDKAPRNAIVQTQQMYSTAEHQSDGLHPTPNSARPTSTPAVLDKTCATPQAILQATCPLSVAQITTISSSIDPGKGMEFREISDVNGTRLSTKQYSPEATKKLSISTDRSTGSMDHASSMQVLDQASHQMTANINKSSVSLSSNTHPPSVSHSPTPPSSPSPKSALNATNSTNTSRTATLSSTGSQPAQPSTQESFFKSVHKRLQQLESNSTLSLKYIEEQSRILRDAFSKVEKRQLATTSAFLSSLNLTVMNELNGFRQAYDQLWQSTVIELDGQRQQNQRELLALSARLTMVADELVWQKRMGILQSSLLLLCLVLVLFGRAGSAYLEMPMMQQMMNRSSAALRSGWESPPMSPSPDSRSPVSLFRRKLWGSSPEPTGGALSDSEKEGLEVRLEPPTPPSHTAAPDDMDVDSEYYDDEYDLDELDESGNLDPLRQEGRPQIFSSLPNAMANGNSLRIDNYPDEDDGTRRMATAGTDVQASGRANREDMDNVT